MNSIRQWMRLVETQGEHDGDAYFDFNNLNVSSPKSRETLVYMSPADFLSMAEKGYLDSKTKNVASLVKQGTKFNSIPFLQFEHNGKGLARVIGHEGRHRARALQAIGVKQMPVVLLSSASIEGKAIRWGSQDNESDHVDIMPTQLQAEDRRSVIPMPKSVIFP